MKREQATVQKPPIGYKLLNYLESTGTQYINTGVVLTQNFEIRCKFTGTYTDTYQYENVFGCQNSSSPFASVYIRKNALEDVGKIGKRYFAGIRGEGFSYDDDGTHYAVFGIDGTEKYFNLDAAYQSIQDTTHQYQSNYGLYLFAENNGGSAAKFGKYKIYEFEVDNEQQTVRNFVPALRLSDNKPGLYDLCESTCPLTGTPFYINSGTGEFLYK